MNHIKQFMNTLKKDAIENWTLALLIVGLPLVAFLYVDWKLALTVFILVNIAIGILSLRKAN